MHSLKQNKTDHKTHFILGANCYMFWHQSAIFREFIKKAKDHNYITYCT